MQLLWCVTSAAVALALLARGQIDPPSVPAAVAMAAESASAANMSAPTAVDEPSQPSIEPLITDSDLINLDSFAVADIEETVEPSKPDNVDNDIIQGLVDQFLNKGTVEQDAGKKINTDAQALINKSAYWDARDLESPHTINDATKAAKWLSGYSAEAQKVLHEVASAAWNYFTAASPITRQYLTEAEEAQQFNPMALASGDERKQLEIIAREGLNALDTDAFANYNGLLADINKLYVGVDVCENKEQKVCIQKYSDLIATIQTTTDAEHAASIWKTWRGVVGANLTAIYAQLADVTNKAAKLNGYADAGAMWRSALDVDAAGAGRPAFRIGDEVEAIYAKLLPFYSQLHAYFRRQIAANYKSDASLTRDRTIPAHLLRSSTGDDFSAAYEDTKPFDQMDKLPEEVTESLHKMTLKPRSMFGKVFRYMRYLGFEQLPDTFWSQSVFSRIWSRDMICNPATAYDMLNSTDFRIKICAQIGQTDFSTAHKLFAKLYYKYLSRDKALVLRDAPSPTMSGAVANAFGLLSTNIRYLRSQATIVNAQYRDALTNIMKIPFSLVADKWRYAVFEGKLAAANWSAEWWSLREKYQGVSAPAGIVEAQYDAVAAAEISQQHAPASRHIVEYVAQFQVLKALCAGNTTALSDTCIPSGDAVHRLIAVMAKGGTISWLDALEEITGQRTLDASALLEYYKPLIDWLSAANARDRVYVGWDGEGARFKDEEVPQPRSENVADRPSVPSDDQIAYPGGSCSHGQECLLDTTCNGTICVCQEGLYTLQIGDTYNCVPDDPANAGFRDGSGLVIAIVPKNQTADANETVAAATDAPRADMPATKTADGGRTRGGGGGASAASRRSTGGGASLLAASMLTSIAAMLAAAYVL